MMVSLLKKILLFVFVCTVYAKVRNVNEERVNALNSAIPSKLIKSKNYRPLWDDLDTRPLPRWYDSSKIGILIHWGVYSVPSFQSEWFWHSWRNGDKDVQEFINKNYNNGFTYQDFAPMLTTELFDPDEWATIFAKAGAKYVILTAKHHDGFTMFPSKRSFSWNAVDVGPKLDIVKTLGKSVKRSGMKFGVYYSLLEWYNPIYIDDKATNFNSSAFTDTKMWPDIKQIINDYKPSILWSDGDWEANDAYWKSPELLAWLYNESPVKDEIVVNDRWGKNTNCLHGDFYNCNSSNPKELLKHKWENAFPMDKMSWGYRRNMKLRDVVTINEILKTVVSTVSRGGNVLINVGPMKDGIMEPIFQDRLYQLGEWLEINGEAIYNTSPWYYQNDHYDKDVWYTCTKEEYNYENPVDVPRESDVVTAVFLIFLKWPVNNTLKVSDLAYLLHRGLYDIQFMGTVGTLCFQILSWQMVDDTVEINLPDLAIVSTEHAWVLKITAK